MLILPKSEPLTRVIFQSIRYYSVKGASSKRWVDRQRNDKYTKQAKLEEFKSRAAFKLMQLDQKYNLFKPNQNVVDLGFAPGAWTQVVIARTQPKARILGIDIIPAQPPKGASAMQASILSKKTHTMVRNFFLDPEGSVNSDDVFNHPSYIEAEIRDNPTLDERTRSVESQFPLDIVISDMYEPFPKPGTYWNNTTNMAYFRMANTSGLIAKDHTASIVSIQKPVFRIGVHY